MVDTGVVHGRFQLFHLDHLKYVLAGKERCRHLVVGITNPDPTLTKFDPADPHRGLEVDNPLTFYERFIIIRETLLEAGLNYRDFSLVPLPINFPELYRYYVPLDATFFLTIYDDWGGEKARHVHFPGPDGGRHVAQTLVRKGAHGHRFAPPDGAGPALETPGPPGGGPVGQRHGTSGALTFAGGLKNEKKPQEG
jgi:hypothetical protein